jgi:hypothetical protein
VILSYVSRKLKLVDSGLVDEHVVVVLVEDHEVIAVARSAGSG